MPLRYATLHAIYNLGSSSYMNNQHAYFVGQGFNLLLFVQKLNERPVHVTLDTAHAPCTELGCTSGKKRLIRCKLPMFILKCAGKDKKKEVEIDEKTRLEDASRTDE
ncbi:hypothetical protein Tco_1271440 [Tanacetum coccineum]